MKKFAFCALIVFAIVGFSFKYGADSRISEDSELRSVTQAAFSLRNTQTSDATAFLIGVFSGDNGTKLSFGGDGTLVLAKSWLEKNEGSYSLTQSSEGAAIICTEFDGESRLYAFTLLSEKGDFRLTDIEGNTVVYTPSER